MPNLAFHIAQLRHAYSHLMAERVTDQRQFAEGLIAPAIEALEQSRSYREHLNDTLNERIPDDIRDLIERLR